MNATTTAPLAILTVNAAFAPVLVIDPGSNLKIGKIIDGLRAKKAGFSFEVSGTTLFIKNGKGDELYRLVSALAAKGYSLEETAAHRNREEAKAERRAEQAERAAIAAIPPRGFAQRRFKWQIENFGIVARYADRKAFINWATAHDLDVRLVGDHRAIIAAAHLSWLRASGIIRTLALPPAADPTPDSSWTVSQLREHCINNNISVLGLTKKAQFLAAISG